MDPIILTRAILFFTMVGAGAALLWTAKAAASGRLKRNQIAGIRIPSTFASEEAWLAAHQRAEMYSVWTAIIAFACAVLAVSPVPFEWVLAGVFGGCIVILVLTLYGARQGSQAAKEVAAKRQRESGNE